MVILCMGLLKRFGRFVGLSNGWCRSIPELFKITLPLLIKPLAPLIDRPLLYNSIADSAVNGGGRIVLATTPAGYTSLLITPAVSLLKAAGSGPVWQQLPRDLPAGGRAGDDRPESPRTSLIKGITKMVQRIAKRVCYYSPAAAFYRGNYVPADHGPPSRCVELRDR